MLRRSLFLSFAVGLSLAVVSCGPHEKVAVEQERSAVVGAIQAVTYKRIIGGSEDTIFVARDGAVVCSGKSLGKAQGTLSEFQMMRLARLFEGWDRLQDHYPAPENSPEAASIQITFGTKTVTASEAAKNLPGHFIEARRRLESLPKELPAAK